MIYCKIENGVVVNRAVGLPSESAEWVPSDEAQIGWTYDGARFAAPPVQGPPPIDFDAVDTAMLNALLLLPGSIDRAELKTLFNHENRIRALEGKGAATQQQFVGALKAAIR